MGNPFIVDLRCGLCAVDSAQFYYSLKVIMVRRLSKAEVLKAGQALAKTPPKPRKTISEPHKVSAPRIPKTGDFLTDVQAGFYRLERDDIYRQGSLTFDDDFRAFLLEKGVPEQYVGKVAHVAYEQGHSGGEEEIVNCSWDLIGIFV